MVPQDSVLRTHIRKNVSPVDRAIPGGHPPLNPHIAGADPHLSRTLMREVALFPGRRASRRAMWSRNVISLLAIV
jgi:hypothetical protein